MLSFGIQYINTSDNVCLKNLTHNVNIFMAGKIGFRKRHYDYSVNADLTESSTQNQQTRWLTPRRANLRAKLIQVCLHVVMPHFIAKRSLSYLSRKKFEGLYTKLLGRIAVLKNRNGYREDTKWQAFQTCQRPFLFLKWIEYSLWHSLNHGKCLVCVLVVFK